MSGNFQGTTTENDCAIRETSTVKNGTPEPGDELSTASLQSLFVPSRKRSQNSSSTIGSKSKSVAEHLELEVFLPEENSSPEQDDGTGTCDDEPEIPLHYLAATGNLLELEIALQDLPDLDSLQVTDKLGRNVLHWAANFHGNSKRCIELILDRLKILVVQTITDKNQWNTLFSNFVNTRDINLQTPLYLAAKNENEKICKVLLINNADWDVESTRSKSPIQKMFKKTPLVIKKTLLKFATNGTSYTNKQESSVQIDFGPIIGYPTIDDTQKSPSWVYEETRLLSNLCYTKERERKHILDHILVKIFIWIKWQKIKYFFWLIILLPIVRLLIYFWFLIRVYRKDCPYPTEQQIEFSWTDLRPTDSFNLTRLAGDEGPDHKCFETPTVICLGWALLFFSIFDLLLFDIYPTFIEFSRRFYPMKTRNLRKYVKRVYLCLKMLGILQYVEFATIILNVLPAIGFSFIGPGIEMQYVIASLGVFFAWFHIFHQLGRIPPFKIYVDLFKSVLVTLFDVAFMYCAIIFAFAMVFCILLPGLGSFSSLSQALLKISTFLIGEIEYETIFYSEESDKVSASTKVTMVFYVIAILVLHIALLNFLVGLTVADIQRLNEDSETLKNFSKVWQITLMETFLSFAPRSLGVPILKHLRIQTGRKLHDEEGYRNRSKVHLEPPHSQSTNLKQLSIVDRFLIEFRMSELPKRFQKELRKLLIKKKMKAEEKARKK